MLNYYSFFITVIAFISVTIAKILYNKIIEYENFMLDIRNEINSIQYDIDEKTRFIDSISTMTIFVEDEHVKQFVKNLKEVNGSIKIISNYFYEIAKEIDNDTDTRISDEKE